jgi:hypothetical protein
VVCGDLADEYPNRDGSPSELRERQVWLGSLVPERVWLGPGHIWAQAGLWMQLVVQEGPCR